MDMHHRNLFHRPRTTTFFLAMTLVAGVLGLTQCKLVDKSVTGVDIRGNATSGDDKDDRSKQSKCDRACERTYKHCRRAEDRRHDDAMDDCKKLEKGSRSECRRDERARHEQEVQACKAAKRACKRDCRYNEGGGKGGR